MTTPRNDQHSQQIQGKSAFFESRKETGSHLQPYGVNKQDQTELFHKMKQVFIQSHIKMPEYNTHKKYPCDT